MSEVVIEVGDRPIREVTQDIQAAAEAGKNIVVTNTLSRHNLGVGLPAGCRIRFEGSVGYYCGVRDPDGGPVRNFGVPGTGVNEYESPELALLPEGQIDAIRA